VEAGSFGKILNEKRKKQKVKKDKNIKNILLKLLMFLFRTIID